MEAQSPPSNRFNKKYYLPARPYGFALFRRYFHLKVTGVESIPSSGPVILVPNHTSFMDPPLLASVVPRVVYFLMLHKHYYHPMLHWLFSRLPCIPVKRSSMSSTSALKDCLQVLHHDQVLCVFPEGGISREHKAKGLRLGAALLALRTQAPIVPVGINGAGDALGLHQRFPRPKPIKINIGEPLYVPVEGETHDKAFLQEITQQTMARVQSLLTGVQ